MSERLSEEERADVYTAAVESLPPGWSPDDGARQDTLTAAVEAILAARLADQAARLAAVEALLRKFHIAGDLTDAQVNDFLAALHPDPSEATP